MDSAENNSTTTNVQPSSSNSNSSLPTSTNTRTLTPSSSFSSTGEETRDEEDDDQEEEQKGIDSTTFKTKEITSSSNRPKRLQAHRACSNCKRLHARCDNERPCKRCLQSGLANTCIDLPRKRRLSRSYTEAVSSVWETCYTTSKLPMISTMGPWAVAYPSVMSPAPIAMPVSVPVPDPLIPKPLMSTEYNSSYEGVTVTEIVNPVEEVVAPRNTYTISHSLSAQALTTPSLVAKDPLPLTNVTPDPLMESILYSQVPERDSLDRRYDFDEIRDRALRPMWHSFAPQQTFAISVWKATNTPGINFLTECNDHFVQLVGYPIEHLKNNFSCQKLFVSNTFFGQIDTPRRSQVITAFGYKDVFLTIFPLIGDSPTTKYFIVSMVELQPPQMIIRSEATTFMMPDVTYSSEMLKQNPALLQKQPTIHYKL